MALVEENVCPLYPFGTPFMWYVKKDNGDMIYEYDDRKIPHWTDGVRSKYLPWLDEAQQEYYRRNISFKRNMGRAALELVDAVFTGLAGTHNGAIRETLFSSITIDKSIKELGLIGNRGRIYFDTSDGIIRIDNDRDLNVHFQLDDIRYNITGNTDINDGYFDLIERHYASYEFDINKKQSVQSPKPRVTAWAIGHKGCIPSGIFKMEYELIFVLPIASPYYIELNLQSDKDMDIELHLTYLANDIKNMVHLEKGKASRFHIAV